MAKISFRVDGWPYVVEYSGSVEIERVASDDVAIRMASDDAEVHSVSLDLAALRASRRVFHEVMDKTRRGALAFWYDSSMGGR